MVNKILEQGAEAEILLDKDKIIKDRTPKGYRLPSLDKKIRRRRTKSEAKILQKIKDLIPVPKLISSDDKEKIEMQFIQGKKLSEHLDSLKNSVKVCKTLGVQIL